jgi:predicted phosphate transport protein (TIGR00153 family)
MLSLLRLIKIYIQKNLHLRQYLITQPTRIMNNIIRLFLPKDRVFYDIFENIVANLKEMGSGLKKALHEDDPTKRTELLKVLEDGEHKNDEYTHQIFIELGKNFITPFDREDIHHLATSLDDIADYIYASSKKILNYKVEKNDAYMKELAEINQKSIKALANAVTKLRNMKNISQIKQECVIINSLENDADEVLDNAIINLFSNKDMQAIDIIKLKDVYEDLEVISDKCEDASNVIESIIIKYA